MNNSQTAMPLPRGMRWMVLGLGAAAFWLAFFHRVAPAAVAGELTRAFDVGSAALGALAATYFYVYTVMQVPTGVLVDTLGPRRVLTVGGVIAGVGSVLFGLADNIALAAAGRTLAGLGVSVAFVSLLKLNVQWFDERRFATAASAANFIGLSGALAATVPLAWLVTFASWRGVFVGIGIASLVVALLTWWITVDHPGTVRVALRTEDNHWRRDLIAVLRNRATWPAFWTGFGISGSYMSFIGLWLVPFLVQVYGFSPVAASRHTSVVIIVLALSAVAIAWLSDSLRCRRPVMIGCALLYVLCWGAWIAGVPAGWTLVMCALTGATAPGFTLAWACAKEVNPPPHAGMAISVANTGGFLAAGILQPLAGWLLDLSKGAKAAGTLADFRPALAVLAAFAVVGLIGAWFIRETHCRNIWAGEKSGKRE